MQMLDSKNIISFRRMTKLVADLEMLVFIVNRPLITDKLLLLHKGKKRGNIDF